MGTMASSSSTEQLTEEVEAPIVVGKNVSSPTGEPMVEVKVAQIETVETDLSSPTEHPNEEAEAEKIEAMAVEADNIEGENVDAEKVEAEKVETVSTPKKESSTVITQRRIEELESLISLRKEFKMARDLRLLVREYSLLKKFSIVIKNDSSVIYYKCTHEDCPFHVKATRIRNKTYPNYGHLFISSLNFAHLDTCASVVKVTAAQLANLSGFRAASISGEKPASFKDIIKSIAEVNGIHVPDKISYRMAVSRAQKQVRMSVGSEEGAAGSGTATQVSQRQLPTQKTRPKKTPDPKRKKDTDDEQDDELTDSNKKTKSKKRKSSDDNAGLKFADDETNKIMEQQYEGLLTELLETTSLSPCLRLDQVLSLVTADDKSALLRYLAHQQQQKSSSFWDDLLLVSNQKALRDDNKNVLEQLLFPLRNDLFMETCFRQRAVYIPDFQRLLRDGKSPYRPKKTKKRMNENIEDETHRFTIIAEVGLYSLDPLSIYQNTSSENIFVWMNKKLPQQNKEKESLIHSIEISDPSAAYALHSIGGHATYCRAPPFLEKVLVSNVLRNIGLGCGQYENNHTNEDVDVDIADHPNNSLPNTMAIRRKMGRGEVEIFISSQKGAVTNWHNDFQENITVQLSGVKRWTVRKGSVQHPIRGCTPQYTSTDTIETQALAATLSSTIPQDMYGAEKRYRYGYPTTDNFNNNAFGETESFVMYPGDVCYFPAGIWHRVEVMDPGVSMNISLMSLNYADIICHSIKHLLLQHNPYRQCVVDYPMIPSASNNSSNAASKSSSPSSVNALQHLKYLLKELPKIMSEFEGNGGAEAILPPVLQSNPSSIPQRKRPPRQNDDDENEGDLDNDKERVINVDHFILPTSHVFDHRKNDNGQYRLIQNPLAMLFTQEELRPPSISNHTDGEEQDKKMDNGDDTSIYILNVNYAGNEMLESAIRICFFAKTKYMKAIQKHLIETSTQQPMETNNEDDKGNKNKVKESHINLKKDASYQHLINFLIFHGYLLFIPNNPVAALEDAV